MKVIRSEVPYVREVVEQDMRDLYIFTDNTDRTSGWGEIDAESRYCKKYGPGKKYPRVTSAHIRGLPNAYPITTQRWYNSQHRGTTGRWTDDDLEEFKRVVDDDFEEIKSAAREYDCIVFPPGGIFNSRIANISQTRTPQLYEYLMKKCMELLEV